MHSLRVKHSSPSNFLRRLSMSEKVRCDKGTLMINNKRILGQFKAFALKNKVSLLSGKYRARVDIHFHKTPAKTEFFILRIHEISNASNKVMKVGRNYNIGLFQGNFQASLISSIEDFNFFVSKGSRVRMIEICIPRKIFLEYLNMGSADDHEEIGMNINTVRRPVNFNDDFVKKMFESIRLEVFKMEPNLQRLSTRVNELVSFCFSEIGSRVYEFRDLGKVKIFNDEINRLIEVRKRLEKDSGNLPPSFSALTKVALMSGTSLKRKFRKMYGASMYEYFQKVRMQRARILLLTHKFSVNQIGHQLGYSNMSNFSIAFKKEFNQLPHELIR